MLYNPDQPVTRVHYAVFLHRLLHIDDPIEPAEPAQPIPRQFARISEQGLESQYRWRLRNDARNASQKVTTVSSRLFDNGCVENRRAEVNSYHAGHTLGQMAKENILYLKRFVEKDSKQEAILDRWLQGDFSQVEEDYFA